MARCAEQATLADGDGAAPGIPPLGLSEVALEFFEMAAAPSEETPGRGGGSQANVIDGAQRVAALAEQGAFEMLQVRASSHASSLLRAVWEIPLLHTAQRNIGAFRFMCAEYPPGPFVPPDNRPTGAGCAVVGWPCGHGRRRRCTRSG